MRYVYKYLFCFFKPQKILSYFWFFTFWINHTSKIPATKTIKANTCSAKNPTALPRKLRMTPKIFPAIASKASRNFPEHLLMESAKILNHFFTAPLYFCWEIAGAPPLPPKAPVISRWSKEDQSVSILL